VQTIQQDANQIIQIIQNGYSAILSEDSALIATCQTSMNAQAAGRGLMGSPTGASMISQCSNNTQYTLDQSKEQLAISQEQMKADAQKQAIENEQCAAPIAPVCPVGASLSGTTCVCGTGRAMWDNICISQAMYNSINCSQTVRPPIVVSSKNHNAKRDMPRSMGRAGR
jgi:predicted RND superfamily exporter protein